MKGYKFSAEARKRMSESHKGYILPESQRNKISIANTGKIRSKEYKENLSKKLRGRIITPEWRDKIRKTNIKRGTRPPLTFGQIPWNKGKKYSSEIRKKISLSQKGRKAWNRGIVGMQKSTKKGKTWEEFYGTRAIEIRKKAKESRAKVITPMKDTSIEVKLQNFLKQLNIEFYPHQYMKEITHAYQCDILIPSLNLVIECDGDYWHNYPFGKDLDHIRTKELKEAGFNILRLWERDIKIIDLISFKEILERLIKTDFKRR